MSVTPPGPVVGWRCRAAGCHGWTACGH